MTVRAYSGLVGLIVLVALLCSCAQETASLPPTALSGDGAVSQNYQIGPEDKVEIQVWKNADLSRTVTVRPDGKISLPLIGDVQAAGLTAGQLTAAVTEKLQAYYKEPAQVTVIIDEVNSYAIYVLGEVTSQGKRIVRTGTTFLQAISLAGGFTQFASKNKITIRRQAGDGKEVSIPLRYTDVLAGKQSNIVLKPGDVVIVP